VKVGLVFCSEFLFASSETFQGLYIEYFKYFSYDLQRKNAEYFSPCSKGIRGTFVGLG
jgi:hypothetical protein